MTYVKAGFEQNEYISWVVEGLAGQPQHSPILLLPERKAQERNHMTQRTAIVANSDIE